MGGHDTDGDVDDTGDDMAEDARISGDTTDRRPGSICAGGLDTTGTLMLVVAGRPWMWSWQKPCILPKLAHPGKRQ